LGRKAREFQLDSWTVGSWTVGQKNHAIARSDDQAILQWILDFVFCICLAFGAWDLEFYRTNATVPTLSWFPATPSTERTIL
jgi:hypothetical protein